VPRRPWDRPGRWDRPGFGTALVPRRPWDRPGPSKGPPGPRPLGPPRSLDFPGPGNVAGSLDCGGRGLDATRSSVHERRLRPHIHARPSRSNTTATGRRARVHYTRKPELSTTHESPSLARPRPAHPPFRCRSPCRCSMLDRAWSVASKGAWCMVHVVFCSGT
jgi:hypothetical protein